MRRPGERAVSGETDLERMLATLVVCRQPGTVAYVAIEEGEAPELDLHPWAVIQEDEGTTLVLDAGDAAASGLPFEGEWAWLSLEVHSSLHAVGLTAALSGALAGAGIPANVLAGYHHDHVLVPAARADEAVEVLLQLRDRDRRGDRGDQGV
jgi:hypothetical protein